MRALCFWSLFLTSLCLGPALAHLLELPHKLRLSRESYLTVQQIYSGWALLGIVIFGAIITILMLSIRLRQDSRRFTPAVIALAAMIGAQVLFWLFTYPANAATNNWTMLPDNWI